jgi:serine/threonine-protein kinase
MADDPHLSYAQRRVGTVIKGKYRIERVLGAGGMAVVYAATSHIEKRVAIKILHPEYAVHDDIQRRFFMEAVAANRVGHPGAVDILDSDTSEDGALFLVMELLEGASLEKLAERLGSRMPLEALLAIAYQALDVLEAAHGKGIVHRDIKPENLFLTADGGVKVLYFGIARVRDQADPGPGKTRGYLGTPAFMAPEQARCEHDAIDARTDVWALGATLFQLLTGRAVYEAEGAQAAIIHAATQPAPSLRDVMPDAPPAVCALVDRATVADKAGRWESARAMAQAVRQTQMAVFGRIAPPPRPSELLGAPPDPYAPTVAGDPRWAPRPALARSLPREGRITRRRAGPSAVLVAMAGVAVVVGLAVARLKPSAATAATPQASAATRAGLTVTCGGEPRVQLDCAEPSSGDGLTKALAGDAATDPTQRQALEDIDRRRRDLGDQLGQLCAQYNSCALDKSTYAARTGEVQRSLAEAQKLVTDVQLAATDGARRVALGVAYRKIVPEAARTELKLDFSALARRPGEATMSPALVGATIPTGSQLAFTVAVSRSAYLYIFEKTASGSTHILFPDPEHIPVDNPVSPGAELRIPQGGAFFRVDDNDIGAENVYLVASLKPIASVARAAERLRLGQPAPPILARVTSIDGNCPHNRGLSFEEESPAPPGCHPMRGLVFERERAAPAAPAAPSLSAITEAADDTIHTAYTFNHTHR